MTPGEKLYREVRAEVAEGWPLLPGDVRVAYEEAAQRLRNAWLEEWIKGSNEAIKIVHDETAEMARREEREACASIAATLVLDFDPEAVPRPPIDVIHATGVEIAKRIRERGKK